MTNESISREQIWKDIDEGRRKISFWKFPSILFPRSNTTLLAGILASIGMLHLGIFFGIWGIFSGRKALRDPYEKNKKVYRIKALIGLLLSIVGIIQHILIYIAQSGKSI